jgi:hypothetical protein
MDILFAWDVVLMAAVFGGSGLSEEGFERALFRLDQLAPDSPSSRRAQS